MNRQIILDSRYDYQKVQIHLNNKSGLKRYVPIGGDGQIYRNGTRSTSGVLLQKCPETSQIIISEMNEYNAFEKLEKELKLEKNLSKLLKDGILN